MTGRDQDGRQRGALGPGLGQSWALVSIWLAPAMKGRAALVKGRTFTLGQGTEAKAQRRGDIETGKETNPER